jgi:hypothetical protein
MADVKTMRGIWQPHDGRHPGQRPWKKSQEFESFGMI